MNMKKSDRGDRYSAAVALLNRDHHAAGDPPFARIDRVSHELALAERVVHGVRVEHVARSTANDVLRGVHTRRLRWELVQSLWAVIHFIAEEDGCDPQILTPRDELHRAFHQPFRPGAVSPALPDPTGPPTPKLTAPHAVRTTPAWSNLPPLPGRPTQTLAASGNADSPCGTGLISTVQSDVGLASLGFGGRGGGDPYEAARRHLANARRAGHDVWWHEYRRVVPPWLGPHLTFEREVALLRSYAPRRVPGLLQTADYTRHVIAEDLPGITAGDMAQRIALREARQQVLRHRDGPHYWAVIDQRALTAQEIPPPVLRGQLRHLIAMAASPRITLQFVRRADTENLVPAGPITLMRFPESSMADIVYLDDHGIYVDDKEGVEYFSKGYHHLVVNALEPHDSVDLLLKKLDELQP